MQRWLRQWPGHPRLRVLLTIATLGTLGCGGDTTGPAPIAPSAAYWALQLNYQAINLALRAPYDTVQLHATALTATGTPVSGAGPATYSTADSTVQVSPTGLVTARYATTNLPAQVLVKLTLQGVTIVDTAVVQVTDTVPRYPLQTLSIQVHPDDPNALQRDTIPMDWTGNPNTGSLVFPMYLTDTHGDSLCTAANAYGTACPVLVAWRTSDPSVATIDRLGELMPQTIGAVTIYATTFAYGVSRQDSLRLVIDYPVQAFHNVIRAYWMPPPGGATPTLVFTPGTAVIGVGGAVIFVAPDSLHPMDVAFDDSNAVAGYFGGPGGNIPPTLKNPNAGEFGFVFRSFPIAGVYTYHSHYGTDGEIIVQ